MSDLAESTTGAGPVARRADDSPEPAADALHAAYETAIVRSRRGIFPEILLACVLAPRDATGAFRAADVRETLEKIVRREVRGVANQVGALTEAGRGAILVKQGLAGEARYRFVDPALETYILRCGLADGWTTSGAPTWLPAEADTRLAA